MDASYYLYAFLLVLAGLLQVTVLPQLRISGQQPDLMLALVVGWSLLRGLRPGLLWALLGGLILDLLSGAPFGLCTISLVGASLLTSLGAATFFRSSDLTLLPLGSALLSSLVYYLISLVLLALGGRSVLRSDTLLHVLLPGVLVQTVTILLILPLVRWLHQHSASEELDW